MKHSVNNNVKFDFVYLFMKFYCLFSCELLTYLNIEDLVNLMKVSKACFYKIANDNKLWTRFINLDNNLAKKNKPDQNYLNILLSLKVLFKDNKYSKVINSNNELNKLHDLVKNLGLTYCNSYYFICLNKISSFYVVDVFYSTQFIKNNINDILNLIHFLVLQGYELLIINNLNNKTSFDKYLSLYVNKLLNKLNIIPTNILNLFMGFYYVDFNILHSNIDINHYRLPCSSFEKDDIQFQIDCRPKLSKYLKKVGISNTGYFNIELFLDPELLPLNNQNIHLTVFQKLDYDVMIYLHDTNYDSEWYTFYTFNFKKNEYYAQYYMEDFPRRSVHKELLKIKINIVPEIIY